MRFFEPRHIFIFGRFPLNLRGPSRTALNYRERVIYTRVHTIIAIIATQIKMDCYRHCIYKLLEIEAFSSVFDHQMVHGYCMSCLSTLTKSSAVHKHEILKQRAAQFATLKHRIASLAHNEPSATPTVLAAR